MPESAKPAPHSVQAGDVLDGKFRVERVLGEGGMGVVVAATHLALGQLVALKFMLPQALKSKDNVARFEREARAVVRLRSEHVARVTDVGRLQNGAPYIVMEFLEGNDLDDVIEQAGPLPVDVAIDYVLQACEAIAEAHALGIVHRDLKPTNLFLTRRVSGKPLVKVLDFGISKSATVGEDLSLTSTTQTMGSPNYMSPEQLRSARNVDHRTDIWALGAILYELLTRQVPFVAETVTQLSVMVVTEEPRPIAELRPDVPPGLVAAIMRCLEKDRDRRFQSVSELAAAIAPFGPPDSVQKAAEIASTSGEHKAYRASIPDAMSRSSPSSPGSVARSAPGGRTASAWDRTQLAPESARIRRRSIVVTSLMTITALSIAAFVVFRRSPATPVDPPRTTFVATASTPPQPTTPPATTASTAPVNSATLVAVSSSHPASTGTHPKTHPTATHEKMTTTPPSTATTPTTTASTASTGQKPLTLPDVRN